MADLVVDLENMRTAFRVAATWHGWSEADQADIGAVIAAAVQAGDEAVLLAWQAWLEDMAGLALLQALCREAEGRIKEGRAA